MQQIVDLVPTVKLVLVGPLHFHRHRVYRVVGKGEIYQGSMLYHVASKPLRIDWTLKVAREQGNPRSGYGLPLGVMLLVVGVQPILESILAAKLQVSKRRDDHTKLK